MSLLKIEDVTMNFGGLTALKSFNLQLMPGEIVGLIGPNGAGKTTVFNIITGVYEPSQGGFSSWIRRLQGCART